MDSIEALYRIQSETDDIDVYNACDEAISALLNQKKIRRKLKHSVEFPCKIGDTIYSIIGEQVSEETVEELRVTKDDVYVLAGGVFRKKSHLGKYWFLDETIARNAFRLWKSKSKG